MAKKEKNNILSFLRKRDNEVKKKRAEGENELKKTFEKLEKNSSPIKATESKKATKESSTKSKTKETQRVRVKMDKFEQKNPFYEYAKSYASPKPQKDPSAKRWRDAALSNYMVTAGQAIGRAISGSTTPINTSSFDNALKKIDYFDKLYREDSRKYETELTKLALHGESRNDKALEKQINYLEKQNELDRKEQSATLDKRVKAMENDLKKEAEAAKKAAKKAEDEAAKLIKESLKSSKTSKSTKNQSSSSSSSSASAKPKIITYLKNNEQQSVPIYQDDVTQLYRIADHYGYLEPYRMEEGADGKRHQLNIALQKAYIAYLKNHTQPKSKGVDYIPKFFFRDTTENTTGLKK